jgi:glutamine amidotransferase
MCRHLGYLGPPATLSEVILDPPYGLYRQSYQPRRQRHGTVNADGFGAGWYAEGDLVPARYRRAGPIWADPSFADLARVTRSRAVLAAVRSASPGTEPGASAAAPYGAGPWLFSHNGTMEGWPASAAGLAGTLSPGELLDLEARCDSALLWALTLNRLRAGAELTAALAATAALIQAHGLSGRFNLLLTDGSAIAATAIGDTLCYRRDRGRVFVASEPHDDEPGWTDVPDRSLLSATPGAVDVRPILRPAA